MRGVVLASAVLVLAGCTNAPPPLTQVTGSNMLDANEIQIVVRGNSYCTPGHRPPFTDPDELEIKCRCVEDGVGKFISRADVREYGRVLSSQSESAANLSVTGRKGRAIGDYCRVAYEAGDRSGKFPTAAR